MSDIRVYHVEYNGRYIGDVRGITWYYAREEAINRLRKAGNTDVSMLKLKLTVVDSRFLIG